MSSGIEKWTARGTGKCSNCSWTYPTFRKPANCLNCNFFIGGNYVPKETTSKKRKLGNPLAVTVCSFEGNTLFSIKVSTKDHRCFCLVSDTSRLCYYRSCKNLRPVSVASGQHQLDKLQCEHLTFHSNCSQTSLEHRILIVLSRKFQFSSKHQAMTSRGQEMSLNNLSLLRL